MKNKKIFFLLTFIMILCILFVEPIRTILKLGLLTIAGLAVIISPFPLIIGLLRLFFITDDKKFTLQLVTYSTIILIIGYSTCGILTFVK
ncbi:hypothetical protein BWK59_11795 [Flavobacterium davisii]|uniref:Uncharacterized protein n=3 Tax=Flavobacterium TaxID=237 RepID=A0A246GGE6_9FLAO|nr:hypothetical protein BWK59_11795 [Flavobacterium davisii]